MKCTISTIWYLFRAAGSSSSSSCHRGYQPRPARPSWPVACADKAHKVDGDGGARACSRTPYAAQHS
eukprot:scaffold23696_cov27-Phaeocystis_antarctica.AAC.1